MFFIDDRIHWSASDLTRAAECEYSLLRTFDYKLGWAEPIEAKPDPLLDHIAGLGDRHEARLLADLEAAGSIARLEHVVPPYTAAKLEAARDDTLKAFLDAPEVIYQAAFFDGEFFGYADFVEGRGDGWAVCDAKLARVAKPSALLQLGAYADQIARMGLPVSATVSLLLGNGDRADFRTADVLPVFIERRARLREMLHSHRSGATPVRWGDERYVACGSCPECQAAAEATDDLLGVAGLRMDQRRKLRSAGVHTITALATTSTRPAGMAQATFEKLRNQARLQACQALAGAGAGVAYELTDTAATMLTLLPAPSAGDLFFDFEGDPLYDEGDLTRVGLEYLWGVLDTEEHYLPIWAHSSAEERAAFVAFMDLVAERRAKHPDMHIYHYAPYETSALKRLAMRYQTREKELDDLLRSEVFVDLYATVRGAVRVGQPSYSIKKLEPLYMGDQLRAGDEDAVGDGGASVVAYHEYREAVVSDPSAAAARLAALADYNEYDCLSTLRLRDWLLDRATDAGVRDRIEPRIKSVQGEELSADDPLFTALMAKSGPDLPSRRTPEQQAYAMLATALDYFRRERKQFWWEHFERLGHLRDDWTGARDVFIVESAEVAADWAVPPGRATNARRTVRLVGDWTPGSKPAGGGSQVVYRTPAPPGAMAPDGAPYGAAASAKIEADADDPRVVILTESRKPTETYADLPLALVPGMPPRTEKLEDAIREIAAQAAAAEVLPNRAVLDILARRAPRLGGATVMPASGSTIEDVVAALIAMDDSYLAIQGPPGTGKTFSGSRVVKELVEKHHWRVGVVAQSHAVVEHMLTGIVKAGLDPDLVGKGKPEDQAPNWTHLTKVSKFLDEHAATGCVVGGTAWDFANGNTIPRGRIDLLIIDEAGQFSLAPTLAASVAAERLLLLGDPQQLPQVSQGTHAEPVDESALGWLMDGHDTLPAELGYFLGQSYRMHPDLCAKVSTLSYDGRLSSAAPPRRQLEGVVPGLGVVSLDHIGNQVESVEEAEEIVRQVRSYVGRVWTDPGDSSTPRPLTPADVLVVAPYNAQVIRIRETLRAAGLTQVRVGTVDKFQGQEAPVALVSMTASSHGDVPRGMGFLLNRNRVNVAVSRAQWRAVVIRSTSLTSYMPSSAHGLLELGAFVGLCGVREASD
ncbi:TM0106 family RecB-like putative nuclease [Nocardioides ochotonae]|uniref:TM0106 family RecB-like putative nuclease n=1 Tax=Nocardioides ochotonae TaxID=2685869 RepID=UPI0014087F9C|nr:bifunctional RecB family nuclease/DEAD/DEAH box helicase [Nocardioides ochotonae]